MRRGSLHTNQSHLFQNIFKKIMLLQCTATDTAVIIQELSYYRTSKVLRHLRYVWFGFVWPKMAKNADFWSSESELIVWIRSSTELCECELVRVGCYPIMWTIALKDSITLVSAIIERHNVDQITPCKDCYPLCDILWRQLLDLNLKC